MSTTAGHPNCLRIAVILFLLTFALCVGALSAQDLEQDGRPLMTLQAEGQGIGARALNLVARAPIDPTLRGVSRRAQAMTPAGTANTDRPVSKLFTLTTAGYLALSASDFYLSNRCIQAGRCVEVGSYRGIASHPLAFALVKMGASSALAATAWSLRKQHPRAAWGTLIGLTVAQGAVVIWNSQQGVRK